MKCLIEHAVHFELSTYPSKLLESLLETSLHVYSGAGKGQKRERQKDKYRTDASQVGIKSTYPKY